MDRFVIRMLGLWLSSSLLLNQVHCTGPVKGTRVLPEKKGRFFLGDHDVSFGITGSKLSVIGGLHGGGLHGGGLYGGFPFASPFLGSPHQNHYGGGGGFFGSLGGLHGGLVLNHYKHHQFYGGANNFHYPPGAGGGFYPHPYFSPFGYFG